MSRIAVVAAGLFCATLGWWLGSAVDFKVALAGAIVGTILGVMGTQEAIRLLRP